MARRPSYAPPLHDRSDMGAGVRSAPRNGFGAAAAPCDESRVLPAPRSHAMKTKIIARPVAAQRCRTRFTVIDRNGRRTMRAVLQLSRCWYEITSRATAFL